MILTGMHDIHLDGAAVCALRYRRLYMSSQKRKRRGKRDRLVLNLLIIVTLVLVVFEGRLIFTMLTHRSAVNSTAVTDGSQSSSDESQQTATESGPGSDSDNTGGSTPASQVEVVDSSSLEATLAGLSANAGSSSTGGGSSPTEPLPTVSDPNSPAIVPAMGTPVDDSYFSDAAFIGDSRMEGFRMASGITQGQFFTSVGMSLSSMRSEDIIRTSDGNITVAAALSGRKYNKVYIMLGTNDLGEYDWDSFRDGFISVIERFREIQPDAVFYICSVIYVEEAKVYDTTYINNTNVDKINSILLDICESEEGFYYLNLNEFLSNGYGALIEGASSDGVHLENSYCKQMLDYLKNHYIEVPSGSSDAEKNTDAETEAE